MLNMGTSPNSLVELVQFHLRDYLTLEVVLLAPWHLRQDRRVSQCTSLSPLRLCRRSSVNFLLALDPQLHELLSAQRL